MAGSDSSGHVERGTCWKDMVEERRLQNNQCLFGLGWWAASGTSSENLLFGMVMKVLNNELGRRLLKT